MPYQVIVVMCESELLWQYALFHTYQERMEAIWVKLHEKRVHEYLTWRYVQFLWNME